MSRRDNGHLRCDRCRLHGTLCICALVPRLETKTRLVLVVHRREARKPTNTGQLAAACLMNSEVLVRGHEGEPSQPLVFAPETQPVLLFPHEGAAPIEAFAGSPRPVTLIVPDGNWRQASKVRRRVPGLEGVPCASISLSQTSYRLRQETHEAGMATLEAIARAFRVLEGERGAAIEEALERVFCAMVERTLWARGALEGDTVPAGIAEGVRRDAPRLS